MSCLQMRWALMETTKQDTILPVRYHVLSDFSLNLYINSIEQLLFFPPPGYLSCPCPFNYSIFSIMVATRTDCDFFLLYFFLFLHQLICYVCTPYASRLCNANQLHNYVWILCISVVRVDNYCQLSCHTFVVSPGLLLFYTWHMCHGTFPMNTGLIFRGGVSTRASLVPCLALSVLALQQVVEGYQCLQCNKW